MITITVLIPAYNEEGRITRALDSIMKQTVLPDEVIVVNDGSTDNTYDIAVEHPLKESVKVYVHNKVNGGLSSARNLGIQNAKCEFIALLDSDDEFEKNHIDDLKQAFTIYPDANIFYAAIRREFSSSDIAAQESHLPDFREISQRHKTEASKSITPLKNSLFSDLLKGNFITTSSSMFRKKIDGQTVFFDESLKYSEDRFFYLNMAIQKSPIFIDKLNVIIHRDGNNISHNKHNYLHRHFSVEVLERIFMDNKFIPIKGEVLNILRSQLDELLYASSRKSPLKTLSAIKKCIKYNKGNLKLNKYIYYTFTSILHGILPKNE